MELGIKIKTLRLRAGLTQEMLAEELGVSFQTISKWENSVCAPDISMLPKLSVYFGVTIDELFDLTAEQRLHRIEKMLDMEQELPHSTFAETVDFLNEQLEGEGDKARIYSFLARVYHHRIMSDSEKVSKYARKALKVNAGLKDCQWLLQKTEGAVARDWNIKNHHGVISFYKKLVKDNPKDLYNYLELIDNLLADNRVAEAEEYLELYKAQEGANEVRWLRYEGVIAFVKNDMKLAEAKLGELEKKYPEDGDALFGIANYYADICEYDKAIEYFEKSFALDKAQQKKPLYTDALDSITMMYEIQEKYDEAVKCCDRILTVLKEEFGFTEGEPVRIVMERKHRLMELASE